MKALGQIIVGILIVLGGMVVIGVLMEPWVGDETVARPTVNTAQVGDVEVQPESTWTTFKQAFYEGCMGERPYNVTEDEMSSYCYCATDYAVDTYGSDIVTGWGLSGSVPDVALQSILDACL